MNDAKSAKLFEAAKRLMPGGVNSPVRAFRAVGRDPLFVARAAGARLWDVDGNEFIDYVGSWGPMILGHAHPRVLDAIRHALEGGTSFGAPTELEVRMAGLITEIVPSVEVVRMVNSGTEATMSAIRLARAFTGREKIIKFEGCYHGHADPFLVKAGSGAMTMSVPDSPGVPAAVAAGTLSATFNDLGSVETLIQTHRGEIAAIIVEPVVGNMGCVLPGAGFLEGLREVCTRESILLLFDEVITGFRVSLVGAQGLYGIAPDLTTFGKIIGGGLPVGAYGGRREIMALVAPDGPVYQAGTLSGNPLAMAAGFETISLLRKEPACYQRLEEMSRRLASGIQQTLDEKGLPATQNRAGSMSTLFFTPEHVVDYRTARAADTRRFTLYFREMLAQGIYLAPSQFESTFVSTAHTEADIDRTIEASRVALRKAFA